MPSATALRALALALAAVAALAGGATSFAQTTDAPAASQPTTRYTTPSGLTIIELGMSDLRAQEGDTVSVHYTGKLADGKVFDSSRTRNEPFPFTIGTTGLIKGWTEGVIGMRVGERRMLIIPPNLGYGADGMPPTIPPNATLTFEIEVLSINRPTEPGR